MRSFLIPLLLMSAAISAVASADPGDNDQTRAERQDRADRGGGGQRARAEDGERQMQARPDIARERPGGISGAAPQQSQQRQQQPQQRQQQEAPRQMRMERPDQAQQQQQQYVDRQSRQADSQVERQQRLEQQQRIDQQQGGFARPDRTQRNGWVNPNGGASAGQPEVIREQRNRGPRIITTDGLPNDSGGFGQRVRPDRPDVPRQDQAARGSFAERLGQQQERNLARRMRSPGLPPGTATGTSPYPGGGGAGGGLQSSPPPGGGELRHSGSGSQWATHWRGDRRYDWRDWRRRHRSSFHIGFYSDPFGFGYQRLGYGWQLFPSYYRSNYWLRDPWQYRLPPVYGPYRWVRYYDDALLVDTWSGEVVDVIYDFFW